MPEARFFAESPESVGIDADKLEALFERAEREVREGLLPSCQVAIGRGGRIAGMRSFGRVTHLGQAAPATNATPYVIFSATKAITSAAAWILMQEGKLDPAERVADSIPGFEQNGKEKVRVEHLLSHTAAFPRAPYPQREWNDRDRRLERFRSWRCDYEPGTRMEYHATSSMWVLGEVIERRSGVDFRAFIRERVAIPLGLDGLSVGLPEALRGRVADIVHVGEEPTAEELAKLGFPVIPETEVTEEVIQGFNRAAVLQAGAPGAGGVGTAGDLALFYQALINGGRNLVDGRDVWKPETIRDALRIRSGDLTDPMFGKMANRALGVVIAGAEDAAYRGFGRTASAATFGHMGAGGQLAWGDPESGISLGYTTNGFDRHPLRQGRRGVAISSRAAVCALAT